MPDVAKQVVASGGLGVLASILAFPQLLPSLMRGGVMAPDRAVYPLAHVCDVVTLMTTDPWIFVELGVDPSGHERDRLSVLSSGGVSSRARRNLQVGRYSEKDLSSW